MKEDEKMEIKKNPKLFEYDKGNDIVDVFVYEDPDCPFPFHNDEERWFHQGFYLKEFLNFINDFFERYHLPYKIKYIRGFEILSLLRDSLSEVDRFYIDKKLSELGI